MSIKNIFIGLAMCVVIVAWYSYYQNMTAPLETKLQANDRIAYDMMTSAASQFKNPASVRLTEAYLSKNKDELTANISGENSMGGHNSTVFTISKDGKLTNVDYKGAGKVILDAEKITGITVNVEKINEAYASHHK